MTLLDLFETFTYDRLRSTASWTFDRFQRPAEDALVTDFWGAVKHVEVTTEVCRALAGERHGGTRC